MNGKQGSILKKGECLASFKGENNISQFSQSRVRAAPREIKAITENFRFFLA